MKIKFDGRGLFTPKPFDYGLMAAIVAVVLLIVLAGCTSETDAMRALQAEGYKDIKFTGYDWFACSKDDFYHTGFQAKNRDGKVVSGVVCSGVLFKGATIRY